MKRSKFSEEQIIAILRGQEAAAKKADVCRRHGIGSATFYSWKSRYTSRRSAGQSDLDVGTTKADKATNCLEDHPRRPWLRSIHSPIFWRVT
jgi:transposase-like protein